MKACRRAQGGLTAVLLITVLATLLSACGADSPTGKTTVTSSGIVSGSTATVGMKLCSTCHLAQTADWLASRHANVEPAGNLYSAGRPTMGQIYTGGVLTNPVTVPATCRNCHDPQGDSGQLAAGYTGYAPRPVVGCESCHGGGSLHIAGGGSGPIGRAATPGTTVGGPSGTLVLSAQFNTCTGCHELLLASDPAGTTPATAVHAATTPTGNAYIITDTHFATPGVFSCGSPTANCIPVSGYAMDYSSETVCSDCHNPHKNADINREWASSRHADTKVLGAWAHYNWSCTAAACGGPAGDRRACQRCHTTSGFAAYVDALQAGNAALAESMRAGTVSMVTYTSGFKPEMLECRGCHTNNRGALRNPGAYLATYAVGTFSKVTYQYPDTTASNVCMPCHTGRDSGKAIAKLAGVNFSNSAYRNVDGHYLTAGGTMFKGTAYEYANRNYADPGTFMHKQIGTSAQPGTGTAGPCLGCHMDRTGMPGNHLFEPISLMSTGTGTAVIVTSEVCFKCHPNSSLDLGIVVQDEKESFENALEALENQLLVTTPSYSFTVNHPYFSNVNWLVFGDTDTTGNSGGKNTMGAAFNFSLLHHEEGAYIHNSRYVKRIIYDSLDWMDDGIMNYSVGATLNSTSSVCGGVTPPAWCAGAKKYLLYGAPNTSGERP